MYLGSLPQDGAMLGHRHMPAGPEPFLTAVAPYREDLVVCGACIFPWYGLADLWAREARPVVLGHALSMPALPAARPQPTPATPRKGRCGGVGACCRRPMAIPRPCGPPVPGSDGAGLSGANGPHAWRPGRRRPARTTCPAWGKPSRPRPSGMAAPSGGLLRRSRKVSQWPWRSAGTTPTA